MKLAAIALLLSATTASAADAPLELKNPRMAMQIGRAEKGAITSLRHGNDELVAAQKTPRLFSLTLCPKDAPPGKRITVHSDAAKAFRAESANPGITLFYSDFDQPGLVVTCTATLPENDDLTRWTISVQVPDGFVLESVRFPQIVLRAPLGENVADDAAVLGSSKGGIIGRPGEMKPGANLTINQPGNMAAGFGCYYDDRAGFYTAALDPAGHPKSLTSARTADGIEIAWTQPSYATGTVTQTYPIVLSTFSAPAGAKTTWRHAADLYKAWAQGQPWCATPFARRTDLPAWLKSGPAMVRFNRDWLAEPARIEAWLTRFRQKHAAPLIAAYWGWEKHGDWVTPDYFPVFPSDEQFAQLVAKGRTLDAHAFPWPSGYHWTLTYDKRADGTFAWDDRERFEKIGRPHAVQTREGSLWRWSPPWLRGGETAALCGSDPWTANWWNQEICLPLTRLGCEMIQVDQVVGGAFRTCYATGHGHPVGPGLWETAAFTRQLQSMLTTMRQTQPDAVVCFEEPNEWFNHLVGIQDYRDCESPREWASVFNYLYHEYLPTFQSNPRQGDLVMMAHCLVDGQMPHLIPIERDLNDDVLANGGFEARAHGQNPLRDWDVVKGYQGVNWTGRASANSTQPHTGQTCLQLENTQPTDIVQISQNVSVGPDGFAVGGRYRLSAWLKTDHMAKPNVINFAVFAPGLRSLNTGGRLPFPPASAGWQRISGEVTIPEGASMMRIMIHVDGPAKAWVDDITLEEIQPDGTTKPAKYLQPSLEDAFMHRWVALYHNEGRPWLQFGQMLHPPLLACEQIPDQRNGGQPNQSAPDPAAPRTMPALFHNAFRAPDGTEAVIVANPTRHPRRATLTWHGTTQTLDLPPAGVQLVR